MVPEGSGGPHCSQTADAGNPGKRTDLKFVSDKHVSFSECFDCNHLYYVLFCLQDPGYATFLFKQLQTPGDHEPGCCQVCSTPFHQLRQEALQTLSAPVLTFGSDMAALPSTSFIPQPSRITLLSSTVAAKQLTKSQPATGSVLPFGERHKVPGWSQIPSAPSGPKSGVQVTMAGGQLTGSLSTVTIQAQQYLEGMWSISRVNNLLPQPKPVCVHFYLYFKQKKKTNEVHELGLQVFRLYNRK